MFLDISENAFLESFDAGKDAAPELILGQVAEESFDHVEPTAAGGREVEMKALVARRPAQNHRVFVGGIVVDDQVQLFVGGRLAIDETQELQPFLMAMTLHASGHHTSAGLRGFREARENSHFRFWISILSKFLHFLARRTRLLPAGLLTAYTWLLFPLT